MNRTPFRIKDRIIGPGQKVYVIAELSANHNKRYINAVRLIESARACGADAVKLQTYTPDTITIRNNGPFFVHGKDSLWARKSLHELYQDAYMPWEWQPKLKKVAEKLGMDCFSSPFDPTAVEFLERMDVPAYKIASFELVDIPLIRLVAKTGKPIIISTGMASLKEIREALKTIRQERNNHIALLKCTSAYPAPLESMNLVTIPYLKNKFNVVTGLSDHSLGIVAPITAVSLGACIIEKHLTLSRKIKGPDSDFSLEPREFKEMVDSVRAAQKTIGTIQKKPLAQEEESRKFRRSLFVVKDIQAGGRLTPDNVRSIRPGHGLHTRYWDRIMKGFAGKDLKAGTPLAWKIVRFLRKEKS